MTILRTPATPGSLTLVLYLAAIVIVAIDRFEIEKLRLELERTEGIYTKREQLLTQQLGHEFIPND